MNDSTEYEVLHKRLHTGSEMSDLYVADFNQVMRVCPATGELRISPAFFSHALRTGQLSV